MENWDKDDILYALRKEGWTLRKVSLEFEVNQSTLRNALYRDYPKGERIIAAVLGRKPEEIWKSRYEKRKPKKISGSLKKQVLVAESLPKNKYISMRDLLALGLDCLPKRRQSVENKARRENWLFVEQYSRGRNGRTRFYVVEQLPEKIRQAVVNEFKNAYGVAVG